MKVKFLNDEKEETKKFRYIKKSKAHVAECVDEKLKSLNLNENSAKKSDENYFKMETVKNSDFKFNFEIE